MEKIYKKKYMKYKKKLLSLISNNNNNNNNLVGGKKDMNLINEKKKFKKISQIVKTLNKITRYYKIKKSKYLVGINTSLFLHKIQDEIDNIDILTKEESIIKKKIKKDLENKIYFDLNIINYNNMEEEEDDDDKSDIFYKYLQKRSFKNKLIYMNKKSKLYIINLEEILIYKLYNYKEENNEEIIKIISHIKKLTKYVKKGIIENLVNILSDLEVPKKIITICKKKLKNSY
jgi:hypothetical protein